MKIEKLLSQFVEKYHENPAFHDTFTDTDMIEALWREKNSKELIANMLTFTLHSAFAKKPAVKKDPRRR